MKTVKVTFANGDFLVTNINGSDEEIAAYYLNNWFNLGTVDDNMQKCVKVEIIE
jgi:hypothetical protein